MILIGRRDRNVAPLAIRPRARGGLSRREKVFRSKRRCPSGGGRNGVLRRRGSPDGPLGAGRAGRSDAITDASSSPQTLSYSSPAAYTVSYSGANADANLDAITDSAASYGTCHSARTAAVYLRGPVAAGDSR